MEAATARRSTDPRVRACVMRVATDQVVTRLRCWGSPVWCGMDHAQHGNAVTSPVLRRIVSTATLEASLITARGPALCAAPREVLGCFHVVPAPQVRAVVRSCMRTPPGFNPPGYLTGPYNQGTNTAWLAKLTFSFTFPPCSHCLDAAVAGMCWHWLPDFHPRCQ